MYATNKNSFSYYQTIIENNRKKEKIPNSFFNNPASLLEQVVLNH